MFTTSVNRPRAKSLHIPIPTAQEWRALRPPTPRRSTYPPVGQSREHAVLQINPDAPPVPALSYWEPDTPLEATSPLSPASPHNPFLYSPSPTSPRMMFPTASPVLPASPLSIFDRVSPMTPSFLFPRTPPVPLLPRERATGAPPRGTWLQDTVLMHRRQSTARSVASADYDEARHEKMSNILAAIRDKIVAEMAAKQEAADSKLTWSLTKKQTDTFKTWKRERFRAMKQVLACV